MKNLSVPAIDKTVKILNLLTETAVPLSGADIAKTLNLPRSSVHGILQCLTDAGLLRKADDRHFVLGAHVLYWANGFTAQQDIVAEFHQAITQIPELNAYTLTLSTLNHDQVVYLACRNSQAPLEVTFRIGMQLPAAFTATGKAVLSHMSDEEVAALITTFPAPYTDNSVRNLPELMQELVQIRRQGFALDNGQLRLGMFCFGIAFTDLGGQYYGVAASLSEQEADEAARTRLLAGLRRLADKLSAA
ncbi:IclR family transcriptional regulator [Neisseria animalis]|uniref:IclR family transcriptional regulator n=1 Tax=Neisseria animalis TaxID=492 RepID=A0A5P3MQN0_NEIAN|nr:IclR family transcriptional regulator [Neisseria animalis]QEY23907.1 IclR family transcriptional regulator [Neisseria animalis]ROW32025.1 IclR family transcriptional regulator [Neisseria animalis]VEE05839.1 Acetate operon repressor [Neisseria animalis]